MLDQALDAFTQKVADILDAERATLFLLDREHDELWSKTALDAEGRSFTIRIPSDRGIVGSVVSSGRGVNVSDAYADPRFDSSTDQETGFRTRNVFCTPLLDPSGEVFGAAQLLNKRGGVDFDRADEDRFDELMKSMGVILASWASMAPRRETSSLAQSGI
ncbi:GAF domain-containing protein [Myxococcota bacterium]|nr:GAF domain-containing protein [Myxococcota bacterium]